MNYENLTDSELNKLVLDKVKNKNKIDYSTLSDKELSNQLYQKYITNEEPKEKDNDSMAALEGFGQGLTLGYLPQIQAKMEPITDRIFGLFDENSEHVDKAPMSQLYSNDENYLKSRDTNVQRQEELAKDNPISYYGTQLVGGVLTGALAAPAKVGSSAIQAANLGAAYGVLSNPGDVEGIVDELQLAPRLKNAVIGAITGYGATKGIEKIAKHSKSLANRIHEMAERRAAKALGAERATVKELGDHEIRKIGRYALDEDIIKPSIFRNTEKMVDRNKAAQKLGGELMEEVYTKIDDVGSKHFSPLDAAAKVDDEIGDFWARSPLNKSEKNQFENTLEAILQRGDDNISLREAQNLKEELGKVAKWKNNIDITDKERMARDAYKVINKQIDDAVEKGAKEIGSKELSNNLQKGKDLYSASKGAEKLLKNKVAREQGNKYLGLTDAGWGGASLAAFGPKGIALLGGKKLLERYGSQVSAKFLDKVANGVNKSRVINIISKKNPGAFQAIILKRAIKAENSIGQKAVDSLKAADYELKGRDKWEAQGLDKVTRISPLIDVKNPLVIKKLLLDKKGSRYLAQASSLKEDSRAMQNLIKKIEQHIKEENK